MKKIAIAIMSLACATCAFAALAVNGEDVKAALAEGSAIFTETKCQVSNDGNRLLIVTGITETELIYQMGYEIDGYTLQQGDVAETNKYYESLTLGSETKTAAEFIDGAEGLLIWEIAYDKTMTYSVQPYAYVGELNDDGDLIAPDGNEKTYGVAKENFNAFTVTFENEDGEELAPTQNVNYGQVLANVIDPEKQGYTFDGWFNGADKVDLSKEVKGSMDLVAKFSANTDTAYVVKVYKEKLLGGGYDLVETINGVGTTDGEVSIDDVTITTDATGFVQGANSVTEGTVSADGSLELSVYYAYPTYSVNKKAWNLNYDAARNYVYVGTASQDSAGLEFATNSQKVYFAGRMVTAGFQNYGFTVTSGTTQRWVLMSNDTAGKFIVRGCNYTGSGFVDSVASFTRVNHNGGASANVMAEYSKAITSGTNKTWDFAVVIKGDVMHVFLDGIFCFFIDLTTIGFTAGSSYNVGIGKTWTSANTNFTMDNIVMRTGAAVDKLFANFEQISYETFTQVNWGVFQAMARYKLDGSVIMQRQETMWHNGSDYNGTYSAYFKNSSNVIYYKSTLTIANGEALSFNSGIGFAIKSGDHKFEFNFGGSSMKQWIPSEADAPTYVVNADKISAITTKSDKARSFEVEYIVSDGTLYMFVDGTLTVKIVLSDLNEALTASADYQIGVLMRWPTASHKVGYYAPTLVYGADAAAAIEATGYSFN